MRTKVKTLADLKSLLTKCPDIEFMAYIEPDLSLNASEEDWEEAEQIMMEELDGYDPADRNPGGLWRAEDYWDDIERWYEYEEDEVVGWAEPEYGTKAMGILADAISDAIAEAFAENCGDYTSTCIIRLRDRNDRTRWLTFGYYITEAALTEWLTPYLREAALAELGI